MFRLILVAILFLPINAIGQILAEIKLESISSSLRFMNDSTAYLERSFIDHLPYLIEMKKIEKLSSNEYLVELEVNIDNKFDSLFVKDSTFTICTGNGYNNTARNVDSVTWSNEIDLINFSLIDNRQGATKTTIPIKVHLHDNTSYIWIFPENRTNNIGTLLKIYIKAARPDSSNFKP